MKLTGFVVASLCLFCQAGESAILPGVVGPWKVESTSPLPVNQNRSLWDEYGLQESEQGVYRKGTETLHVEAWRLIDSTASLAAFHLVRPADAKPAPTLTELSPNSAIFPRGALVALGNYLVRFEGWVPQPDAVANMFRSMPRFEHSGLPTFPSYLPAGEVPNSPRYVGGPVALRAFFPEVASSAAGFRLGAEAMVASYPPNLKMALFSYPTPGIARDRFAELSRVPGAVAKRTGPFVAVVVPNALQKTDPNRVEALLSQVRYQATVTTGQKPPSKKDNPGNLLLNIVYLIGILLAFCVLSGVVFGLFRMLFRRSGPSGDGEEILALHLEQR